MSDKTTIAVIFGGRSVEHDVSVLTGLQFIEALDQSRYRGLPVYVDPEGQWWTGAALLKRSRYPIDAATKKELDAVTLPVGVSVSGGAQLLTARKRMVGSRVEPIGFDLMVPAIHGTNGEDGSLQGLLEFAGIPFAGCRALGAAASMDKHFTKEVLKARNIPLLPHLLVERPEEGGFVTAEDLAPRLEAVLGGPGFPYIVKPRRLGSSVGVKRAGDMDALVAALMAAFRIDSAALVEPLVPNLVEYNVAVRRKADGTAVTSAIERPLQDEELLDFKTKYLAGGSGGPKLDEAPSEGMASLNRELHPKDLSAQQEQQIRASAVAAFDAFDLAGSVRADFLCDGGTGGIWLNELNSIPGSFAFFLWQAAKEPLSFTELTDAIVSEGFALHRRRRGETAAAAGGAQIFRRG